MLACLLGFFLSQTADSGLPKTADDAVRNATVRVLNRSNAAEGNGVAIDRVANVVYVLTAAHIFRPNDQLEVMVYPLPGSGGRPSLVRDVKIVGASDPFVQDLAILHLTVAPKILSSTLPLAPQKSLPARRPFKAWSVASTLDGTPEPRPELVLDGLQVRKGNNQSAWFWKTKAVPEEGRSGGPLVDSQGRLLGICSGGDGKAGFYTHLEEIHAVLKANGLRFLIK